MKKSGNISAENLIEFSKQHIFYEVWMLYRVVDMLANKKYKLSKDDMENQVLFNSLLESMIVHSRIILDFLYCKRIKPDDAIASDYFSKPSEWESLLPKKTPAIRAIINRSNKEMAHLSYLRLTVKPEERSWEVVKVKNDIKNIIDLFLEKADVKLLHSDVYALKGM